MKTDSDLHLLITNQNLKLKTVSRFQVSYCFGKNKKVFVKIGYVLIKKNTYTYIHRLYIYITFLYEKQQFQCLHDGSVYITMILSTFTDNESKFEYTNFSVGSKSVIEHRWL